MKSLGRLARLARRLPLVVRTTRHRHRGFSDGAGTGTGAWDAALLRQALRQVAAGGELEADQLLRLRGNVPTEKAKAPAAAPVEAAAPSPEAAAPPAAPVEEAAPEKLEEPEELPKLKCSFSDMLQLVDLCKSAGLQDFVGLGELADRLVDDKATKAASASELLRLASTFSMLGVLHPPLFTALTTSFLRLWPAPADGGAAVSPGAAELTRLARALAAQRFRHEELFGRFAVFLRRLVNEASGKLASVLSGGEALSLLHSHAFLRLGPPHGELDELWQALEDHVTSEDLSPEAAMKLCHVLFLARLVDENSLSKVVGLLTEGTRKLQQEQRPLSVGLHRRVLLLRSAMRYLHHPVYKELPDDVLKLFRKAHRMDAPLSLKASRLFVRKLSHTLTKLKIGHLIDADRGPFTFDIVERDRKLVYECNHFDRFYAYSTEKIASMCLQERIVKAMGYRVVQVPHWHWNKIRHKKQRTEYIRMSRYYALKDRREMVPRDEEVQDVAVNELDFMGEYFFRKDMPQTHFAWFQPRYDAKLRIPQSSKEKAAEGTL